MAQIIFKDTPAPASLACDDMPDVAFRTILNERVSALESLLPADDGIYNGNPARIAVNTIRTVLDGYSLGRAPLDPSISLDTHLASAAVDITRLHGVSRASFRDSEFSAAVRKQMKQIRWYARKQMARTAG